MRLLQHNHRDRMPKILASKGGIITLRELRRSMEIKVENLGSSLFGVGVTGDTNPQGFQPSHLD